MMAGGRQPEELRVEHESQVSGCQLAAWGAANRGRLGREIAVIEAERGQPCAPEG